MKMGAETETNESPALDALQTPGHVFEFKNAGLLGTTRYTDVN